jgi:hypothetical protein
LLTEYFLGGKRDQRPAFDRRNRKKKSLLKRNNPGSISSNHFSQPFQAHIPTFSPFTSNCLNPFPTNPLLSNPLLSNHRLSNPFSSNPRLNNPPNNSLLNNPFPSNPMSFFPAYQTDPLSFSSYPANIYGNRLLASAVELPEPVYHDLEFGITQVFLLFLFF